MFGSKFKIKNYSIIGDKKLGNKIYSKLHNLSKMNEKNPSAKNISLLIDSSKEKEATAISSTGKILGYKINLTIKIKIKNLDTGTIALDENFISSLSYKVQSQYSDTLKFENTTINNLNDKTYEDLIIKLSENIL